MEWIENEIEDKSMMFSSSSKILSLVSEDSSPVEKGMDKGRSWLAGVESVILLKLSLETFLLKY